MASPVPLVTLLQSGILDRTAGRPCERVAQEFSPRWPHTGDAVEVPQCSIHGGTWTERGCEWAASRADLIAEVVR